MWREKFIPSKTDFQVKGTEKLLSTCKNSGNIILNYCLNYVLENGLHTTNITETSKLWLVMSIKYIIILELRPKES